MADDTVRSSFTISQKGKKGQKKEKREPTEEEKEEQNTRKWRIFIGYILFIITGLLLVILTVALTAYNWPSLVQDPEEHSRTPRLVQLQHADSANASTITIENINITDNTNNIIADTNVTKNVLKLTQEETKKETKEKIPVIINVISSPSSSSSDQNSSVQNVDIRDVTETAVSTPPPTNNSVKPTPKSNPKPNPNSNPNPDSTNHRSTSSNPHLNLNPNPILNPNGNTNINAYIAHQRLFEDLKGNSTFVQNKTIYGAIIMTDYSAKPHVNIKKMRLQNSTTEIDKMQVAVDLSSTRSKNSRDMIAQLPFPVIHWPPVFSKACPYSPSQHKSERGLLYAHLQIWLDFVYFDYDVKMKASEKSENSEKDNKNGKGDKNEKNDKRDKNDKKLKGNYESDDSGYARGTFTASENGTLYKNGSPYRDENILVVFEDDADIAVIDVHNALHTELSNMNTDLLFLGWCVGRAAKPVPLCTHAYAFTMTGARKAIKYLEPCGRALDEQFVIFAKNNWITYREAFPSSYRNKFNSNYPKQGDGTHGVFHQKKMGSFNGH